ncbi:MAG: MarR family transcriptional regulator [Solirubrobacteraceae bacterium]|jgi:DNA-binding MarR family transcriptional regulator
MNPVAPQRRAAIRHRQQLTSEIRGLLRQLRIQLALLNHRIGAQIELRDVDLDCLDLITLHGPLSPSELARRAGFHPATMTGILDRLERGRWATRERDPADRRAVLVRALNDRNADLMRLYAPMSNSMNAICAGYADSELELLADFLRRTTNAGQDATSKLSGSDKN